MHTTETFSLFVNDLHSLTSFNSIKRAKVCVEIIHKKGSEKPWQEYISMEHIFYNHVRVEINTCKQQLIKLIKTGKLEQRKQKSSILSFDNKQIGNVVIGDVKLDDLSKPYRIRLANSVLFKYGLFFVQPPKSYPSTVDFLRECCTWDDLGGLALAQSLKVINGNKIYAAILLEDSFIQSGDIVEVSIPSNPELDDIWAGLQDMAIPVVKL